MIFKQFCWETTVNMPSPRAICDSCLQEQGAKVNPYSKHTHPFPSRSFPWCSNTQHLICLTLEGLSIPMVIMWLVWSLLKNPGLPWESCHEDPYQAPHLQLQQKVEKINFDKSNNIIPTKKQAQKTPLRVGPQLVGLGGLAYMLLQFHGKRSYPSC